VVGKGLEVALVVLYVGLVATVLYAGVVPEYRAAAGSEVGDRTLAAAALEVETAVPPALGSRSVSASRSVRLPDTIAGESYRVRVDGRALVLEHPDPAVGGRARLALPGRVERVRGGWASGGDPTVTVSTDPEGLTVVLDS
jgi:hypothetical protein